MNLLILSCIVSFCSGVIISSIYFFIKLSVKEKEYIKLAAKTEISDSIEEILKRDFTQIANDVIKQEQEDLRKQNREALEEKILPLTKELTEFKSKVEQFNISGIENTAKIITQINNLEKNNRAIEEETKTLVTALTKHQNIKGAYGEEILETILQNSGLHEGIHYFKQYSTNSNNNDGTLRIRPDIIINLPNNRHLIIDSKVTLTSYMEYISDASKLKDFKNEVKKRINDLASKNYQNALHLYQPDFILMYMPIDASVSLIYQDAEIIELAYKSNIIVVGTASLLAAIRLVNQLFVQQKQNENIQKIVDAGTNLYETFVQFCEDLIELQKKFATISQQFTTVINRFKRSNKNKPDIFSQIETLKSYGINTANKIPEEFLSQPVEKEGALKND